MIPISRICDTFDIIYDKIYNKILKNDIGFCGLYDIMYSETERQGLKLFIHFTSLTKIPYKVHERSWSIINHVSNNSCYNIDERKYISLRYH